MRAQIDRKLYKKYIQEELFHRSPNLEVLESAVEDLIIENNDSGSVQCKGIVLGKSNKYISFFFLKKMELLLHILYLIKKYV